MYTTSDFLKDEFISSFHKPNEKEDDQTSDRDRAEFRKKTVKRKSSEEEGWKKG